MKLILGLIWSLIAHYQLGASNFPPKKLMLAWLKVSLLPCYVSSHLPPCPGRPPRLQHQELHLRLEQWDQPGRPAGLL